MTDYTDLEARLREWGSDPLCREAADAIRQLRAKLADVREAQEIRARSIRQQMARAEAAEAKLADVRAALEPFAALANRYDPPDGDDDHAAWDQTALPVLGDLRRARAALARLAPPADGGV